MLHISPKSCFQTPPGARGSARGHASARYARLGSCRRELWPFSASPNDNGVGRQTRRAVGLRLGYTDPRKGSLPLAGLWGMGAGRGSGRRPSWSLSSARRRRLLLSYPARRQADITFLRLIWDNEAVLSHWTVSGSNAWFGLNAATTPDTDAHTPSYRHGELKFTPPLTRHVVTNQCLVTHPVRYQTAAPGVFFI